MIGTSFGIVFGAFAGLLIGRYINFEAYGLIIGAGIGFCLGLAFDKIRSHRKTK